MTITRIYAAPDGQSRFEDVEARLENAGEIGRLSKAWPATGAVFRETEPTYDYDWHHPPERQLIILLDGAIEIEVSGGKEGVEKRRFSGGDVLLAEDLTGDGHRTRALSGGVRRSIFVPLPKEAALEYERIRDVPSEDNQR